MHERQKKFIKAKREEKKKKSYCGIINFPPFARFILLPLFISLGYYVLCSETHAKIKIVKGDVYTARGKERERIKERETII